MTRMDALIALKIAENRGKAGELASQEHFAPEVCFGSKRIGGALTDDEIHAEFQKAIGALAVLRRHMAARSEQWSRDAHKGYAFGVAQLQANRADSAVHDFWSAVLIMEREFARDLRN